MSTKSQTDFKRAANDLITEAWIEYIEADIQKADKGLRLTDSGLAIELSYEDRLIAAFELQSIIDDEIRFIPDDDAQSLEWIEEVANFLDQQAAKLRAFAKR